VTRRLPAASVLAVVLFALPLLASAPSASASNLKTRVWDFFEDCPLCTDGEPDLSQQSSSGKTASCASDCSWRNLFYNRFRYYDPACGRYVSPDPAGAANAYEFAPNTTGWVDPFGLKKRSRCEGKSAGGMRSVGRATLRRLGLEGVDLAGRSFGSGRKQLEKAGFRLDRVTPTGRRVFVHPRTGAQVAFDSGKALSAGQKPHWHIMDEAGRKHSRTGRVVDPSDMAGHIPGG